MQIFPPVYHEGTQICAKTLSMEFVYLLHDISDPVRDCNTRDKVQQLSSGFTSENAICLSFIRQIRPGALTSPGQRLTSPVGPFQTPAVLYENRVTPSDLYHDVRYSVFTPLQHYTTYCVFCSVQMYVIYAMSRYLKNPELE
jgi:hypothetical protein